MITALHTLGILSMVVGLPWCQECIFQHTVAFTLNGELIGLVVGVLSLRDHTHSVIYGVSDIASVVFFVSCGVLATVLGQEANMQSGL